MELEKKKKLYAEDDISKLAVLKSNNDTVASKVGQNLRVYEFDLCYVLEFGVHCFPSFGSKEALIFQPSKYSFSKKNYFT
jgi:hypothetical protein